MVTWYYGRISFSEFNSPARVTFQVYTQVAIEIYQSKNFALCFENKSVVAKREAFCDILFRNTVFS